MISRVIELWSPSQIGPVEQDDVGRLDEVAVDRGEVVGLVSRARACRGQTPGGITWSTVRTSSTRTPTRSRMPRGIATSPSVWLSSGERFSVPLKIDGAQVVVARGRRIALRVDEVLDRLGDAHVGTQSGLGVRYAAVHPGPACRPHPAPGHEF